MLTHKQKWRRIKNIKYLNCLDCDVVFVNIKIKKVRFKEENEIIYIENINNINNINNDNI